ncbi:hypothetical protein [Streptomyces sp. NPDC058157]|uniref:hypothetical protein n=1 Tax=Streptomyces sp. NPDC058157 TaxID=3346360 RepID=UPI0036EE9D88
MNLTTSTTNFPVTACAISVADQSNSGGSVSVEVLTTTNQLWEITCSRQNNMGNRTLVCPNAWTQNMSYPPTLMQRNFKNKPALAASPGHPVNTLRPEHEDRPARAAAPQR